MSARRYVDAVCAAVLLLALAGFVLYGRAADGAAGAAGEAWGFRAFANVVQVLLLAAAVNLAWRSAVLLGSGTPAHTAWVLLAAGLGAFLAAELADGWFEVVRRTGRPFPSLIDVLFVGAYVLLVPAFVLFIRAYSTWGVAVGGLREHAPLALGAALVLGAAGYSPLWAIGTAEAPLAERVLGVVYPLLDFAVLVLGLVLLRITLALRGGRVWRVWALLLAGVGLTCVADVLFALLPASGVGTVQRPLMETLYVLSYLALARGAFEQRELVAG